MRENVLAPAQTRVRNIPITEKIRAVEIRQGDTSAISFDMRQPDGTAIDLTEYDLSSTIPTSTSTSSTSITSRILLRISEFVGKHVIVSIDGEVTDDVNGVVQADVPAVIAAVPGIYAAEFLVVAADDAVYVTNTFYLTVVRTLAGTTRRVGPPTPAELRLYLRDSAPEESYLLDHIAWDTAELAEAVAACVEYWNESLPPTRTYTTSNFPYRQHWIDGIIAILFRAAAGWYHRNDLQYSAAGVNVADMRKATWYNTEGLRRWQEFTTWVQQKKMAENIRAGFGGIGSPYSWGG